MESSFVSRLPSIASTKPYYISPYHKPSPHRYRSRENSQMQTKTIDNSRIFGYSKDFSKLQQLRYYIESTIQNQKKARVQSLAKRKQLDDYQLQRKRQRAREQRKKHQQIMTHMKQYLKAMKNYYWIKTPCKCGCIQINGSDLNHTQQATSIHQPKKVQYRLNNVRSLRNTEKTYKTEVLSFSRKYAQMKTGQFNLLQRDVRDVSSQMKDTANSYFTLLNSLQKSVKTHLSSSRGISNLLSQLVKQDENNTSLNNSRTHYDSKFSPDSKKASSSKLQVRKSIFNVLSLTKNNWQNIFKSVVVLKGLQNKLHKIAQQNNMQIKYSQSQKQTKQIMDSMFKQLFNNKQYFSHINQQLNQKGVQNEIKERVQEFINENDYQSSEEQEQYLPRNSIKRQKERQNDKQRDSEDNADKCELELPEDYYLAGQKSEIHENMDIIIGEFMKNQNLVKERKKAPKKTLLQTLGIEHLIQHRNSRNSSIYKDVQNNKYAKRSTAVPTYKQLAKRSFRLNQLKKQKDKKQKQGKEKKVKKKKQKVINQPRKMSLIKSIEQQKQNIEIEQVPAQNKRRLKRNQENFMNGLYHKIVIPGHEQPECTLNPLYQKQNIYNDSRVKQFNILKSIKPKKNLEQSNQNSNLQPLLQLLGYHDNIGIIKTRLIEFLKHDYWMSFRTISEQFHAGQNLLQRQLQKLQTIIFQQIKQQDFSWIDKLSFDIDVNSVDVGDLVFNQKIKDPMLKSQNQRISDLADFVLEKRMTRYESDCENKRLKAFSIENSYMKHKRQNSNNNIELIQNNSYA